MTFTFKCIYAFYNVVFNVRVYHPYLYDPVICNLILLFVALHCFYISIIFPSQCRRPFGLLCTISSVYKLIKIFNTSHPLYIFIIIRSHFFPIYLLLSSLHICLIGLLFSLQLTSVTDVSLFVVLLQFLPFINHISMFLSSPAAYPFT